jgi:hypothetical protein
MRRLVRAAPLLLVLAPPAALLVPRDGASLPLYAGRTGLDCASCHFDPNGGGPRNEFGFAYGKNRHALEPEPEGSPWADLNLRNRVGDDFPLYFGVNQRFMLIATQNDGQDSLARLGFYNMESSIHLAFQPHSKLTLVYTLDAFSSTQAFSGGFRSKEAFGLIGSAGGLYLKLGRFRTPFGLRMDDHTVATRRGFLDFGTDVAFLPYDPRQPDMGIEVGGTRGAFFGRASWTDGAGDALSYGSRAGAFTGKLGLRARGVQVAGSLYDDQRDDGTLDAFAGDGYRRTTRWGLYALGHAGPVALLGEWAAGTDQVHGPPSSMPPGSKVNRNAWWLEADWGPRRWINLRARYDQLVLDRAEDEAVRDASTHSRFELGADWSPVPFAELRASLRFIDHKDATAYGYPDETQAYLQAHFTY